MRSSYECTAVASGNFVFIKHPRIMKLLESDRYLIEARDVSNVEDVVRLGDITMRRFGRIDVLINNAGISARGGSSGYAGQGMASCVRDQRRSCIQHDSQHSATSHRDQGNDRQRVSELGGDRGLNFYNAAKGRSE